MNRSLRTRLLIGIAVATTCVFAVAMGTLYLQTKQSLLADFDETLAAKSRAMIVLIEETERGVKIEFAEHPMHEFARKIRPEYYQVRDESGETLVRSRRLGTSDLPIGSGMLNAPDVRVLKLPDGRDGRMVCVHFRPNRADDQLPYAQPGKSIDDSADDKAPSAAVSRLSLVVAAGTDELESTLFAQASRLVAVSLVAITGLLGILAWFVSRCMQPLTALAGQIGSIDEQSLSTTIDVPGIPAEVQPVVARLNKLMLRLQDAFHRERSFSSNVAHELRTPIAGLRSTLEVALTKHRSADEYRDSIKDCVGICEETQRLVETLLSLTRIESGQETPEYDLIDLPLTLGRSWRAFESRADERRLQVSWNLIDGTILETDSARLRLVFANLFDNAVCYTADAGELRITSTCVDSVLRLTIANSGCQLAPDAAEKVCDRFWRADSARAATGTHAGLGLSLSRQVCDLLELTFNISVENGWFVATIEFAAERVQVADIDAGQEAGSLAEHSGAEVVAVATESVT